MQFKIEKIILILKDNDKREIEFHKGVNIIAGKSQTGKSALIDIIDYCLFSSMCTIPKGIIYDSVNIYCLVLWVNGKRLILARKKFDDIENGGKSKIFVYEINQEFNDNKINNEFFIQNKNKFISEEQFKNYHIKNILNIPIESQKLDDLNDSVLSFRSMTSFMFQHQNLMASKFALFYRLDSFTRAKQTQRDFKLFMNINNLESIQREEALEAIKKQLKRIEKEEKFFNEKFANLLRILREDCINFYALLGNSQSKILQITEFNENDILEYNNILEDINNYILESNIPEELEKLKSIRDASFIKYNKLRMQLGDIQTYENELSSTRQIFEIDIKDKHNLNCPLCGILHDSNNEQYEKAKNKIKSELSEINLIPPKIIEQKNKLEDELKKYKQKYEEENSKYFSIRNTYQHIVSQEDKKEKLLELKSKIKSNQQILKDFKIFNNKEKEELLQKQKNLQDELAGFNFETTLKQVEVKIAEYINEIINNGLELEKSLGDANLYFNIEEFSLFQNFKSKRIYLSEMGSGSNWLNCHIALMLGLHKYIALNNSKIPSFIFFDQPSQVYFPSEEDINKSKIDENKESDLTTVKNIFRNIIKNIEEINSNKNVNSQIQLLITDHYSTDEEWFTKHIIKDGEWINGKKLVPIKYEK
ncbi:DUF3732 domain-containing protein [Sulfurimonas sp.]|uniref:DUF3732 domain-containing protein n=1 Tax=Sulfurimonas sp. TaxID=2022749 RepID=UPI00262658CA|nr:DUF3732 domain-containing protein [Sulfurimonas sp.]MDD3854237.1 DUF3732 domain-containing protein [Sulfurimonas sp.]